MSSPPIAPHVYARDIRADERTSLSVLASHVPAGARVLDLGCGSGAVGRFLAARDGAAAGPIDGLTINGEEARLAAASYRRVEVADLDACRLTGMFEPGGYDRIVCADVLEHIRQSDRVLAECGSLLAEGGRVLLSIPNAGYAGLVAELMAGEFRYRPEGLLDDTHLRFYTRRTLMRFLRDNGWAVEHFDTIERQLPDSEFRVAFDALPPAVARHLLALPDALTYQFIVAAHPASAAPDAGLPAGGAQPTAPAHAPTLPAQALFSAQLYWDEGQGYGEDRKQVQAGVIGRHRQQLRFALPPGADIRELKLDPADRPGILYLYGLTLRDARSGDVAWQWSMQGEGADALLRTAETQQITWGVMPGGNALSAVLGGDDPWIKLPIAAQALRQACAGSALVLDVDLGWPMSADYLSLAGLVAPLQAEQRFLRSQAARVAEVTASHEKLALEHAQLHRLHAELRRLHDELRRDLAQEQRERRHLVDERERLRGELAGMAEHVANLSNLRSVRYARRLSRLLRALRPAAAPAPAAAAAAPAPPAAEPREAAPVPPPASDTVDVIVPVYRGLADTRLCIESVLASPVATPYRLIVVNDASPEPEVTAWLREKAAREPRIALLENAENLGFVGTVNRGMKHSDRNDVLLLNSDTEVANDWLDRLRRAAYAFARGGSVTPFSSNATICSYPVFCAANPLPDGETTASLDRLFARANAGQTVDVPTGVGFCMYIRRDCLSDVGFFDEAHFGKGYGEENDFCQRALRKGWRSLHALDTYVLHTGGVSFGDSKSPREQAAMQTLRRLHPGYGAQVQDFVRRDPARPARLAVDWLRATGGGRKTVVLAVHHQRGGGTERHVLELARHLADAAAFVSLKPAGPHHVALQLIEPAHDPGRSDAGMPAPAAPAWRISDTWRAVFDLDTERAALLQMLRATGVAHVHYHHLLGHHRIIWELPGLLGVGYDFTSHDFYSHCTNITLTGRDNRYKEKDAQGECCGGQHPPSLPPLIERIDDWRIRNRTFLEQARFVLAPSLDAASRMRQSFPSARVRFAPHTDVDRTRPSTPEPRPLVPGQPMRIAVIGALSAIKGADVLEDTARLARKAGLPLEFHLIGFGYRHLQTTPATALKVHGQYDDAALPALLQRVAPHVVWFPALWPETYSYTLSAALQADLPVVVPDLGAFAERVAGRPWSWVHGWDATPRQWLDLFTAIHAQWAAPGGQPPVAPPAPPALQALAQALEPWDYARDYLVAPAPASDEERVAAAQAIGRHIAAAQAAHPPVAAGTGLYGLALRAQRSRVLAPLMRAVPPSWRYRIKQILSR